ncbi:MAG: 30S ribosomal protein S9 [Solirubrobacterales bacterium]|nr:30S ribosomal protein S9 [Solirubrobacterales bacterium]
MADEPQDTPQDEPTPEQPDAEAPAAEEADAGDAAAPEAAASDDAPTGEEAPAAEADADASGEPDADATPTEQPDADATPPEQPEAEQPAGEEPAERPKPKRKKDSKSDEPEVIPGAHLEPDLVLEEDKPRVEEPSWAGAEVDGEPEAEVVATSTPDDDEEVDHGPLEAVLDLAADARYRATGKRKSAVARVTLKPGTGKYEINGRTLEEYFPRPTLQTLARRPLETVGQQARMDVVAKIHGGGISAQAGALRHGITRAIVDADPNLRGELKRRGFLTRDPRVKERKKAGLKKARKRPQFSKR